MVTFEVGALGGDWPVKQSQDDASLKKKKFFSRVSLPFRAPATASGNFLLCNNGEPGSRSVHLPCFASLNCVFVTSMTFSGISGI